MKRVFSLALLLVLVAGCTSNQIEPSPTSAPTFTPSPTETLAPTETPAPTCAATATPDPRETILFEEDFEDNKAQGFTFQAGSWKIISENDCNKVLELNNTSDCCLSEASFGSKQWADYAIEYRVKFIKINKFAPVEDLFFRKSVNGDYYVQSIIGSNKGNPVVVVFFVPGNDDWQAIDSDRVLIMPDTWYSIRVEAKGENLRVYVDDYLTIEVKDTQIEAGSAGLSVERGSHIQFDDIRVISLEK